MKKLCVRLTALLLLSVLLVGCFAGCQTNNNGGPSNEIPTTPITVSILVARHDDSLTDSEELWYFKYLEYWLGEQGYDVTINATNGDSTQASLMLTGNNLPDIIFGLGLSSTNAVQYGMEEEMLLDWTPYINETYMPNLTQRFEEDPGILSASTLPNGAVYGLPYIKPRLSQSGCYGTTERLYFRQSWLDAIGMKNPETEEELMAVLRAMKAKYPDRTTIVTADGFLEKYLWACLGFYGTEPGTYGTSFMIKNEEIVLPAYTDSYKDFIDLMATFYKEGIISQDYNAASSGTIGAYAMNGGAGGYCWWTLGSFISEADSGLDWVSANPIPLGDVETVEDIHVSNLSTYEVNKAWASASTQYPALIAKIMDFMYSDEGAFLYRYGVPEGEDPLGLIDGYTYDENGDITTKLVQNGTYPTISGYGRDILFPFDNVGVRPAIKTSGTGNDLEYIDSVTGETYTVFDSASMDPNENDGHWRLTTIEHWSDRATCIRLPAAFQDPDDVTTYSDYQTVINEYIKQQSAKYISGQIKFDDAEFAAFKKQLEELGVKEYIEMYKTCQAKWMKNTFGE